MASTITPFNLINPIPQHRLAVISNSGSDVDIIGVPLIIDDEISIKVDSKYGQLWEGSSNNLMNLLAGSFDIPSGQFALQGLQIWNSTDPIKISFTARIEMDDDPINDVMEPVRILMCKCLPHYSNGTTIEKATLNDKLEGAIEKKFNVKLKTLIPPGPNLQTIFQEMSSDYSTASNTFNLKLGYLKFRNMVFTSVEPKFSKDVCYVNGKPYPISADVSLEFSTIEIATTNMISGLLN